MVNETDDFSEKFTLQELKLLVGNDERFAAEALKQLQALDIGETWTVASSATGLINHWLVERDLAGYDRGREVDDFAALTVSPDENGDTGPAVVWLEKFIYIKRDDLVTLLRRVGMTVPPYLLAAGSQQAIAAAGSANKSGQAGKETIYLATEEELIAAFNCKRSLFKAVRKGTWMMEARKEIGTGRKNPSPPRFDPYAFVLNLPKSDYGNGINETAAWRKLESHFPDRYEEVDYCDPRNK